MPAPSNPYQPYAEVHKTPNGAGDARPTAKQILVDCNAIGKLKNKAVLITGCSAGLGVETARALYEAGATLFLTARDIPKLEGIIEDIVAKAEVKGVKPVPIECHLDSLASVRQAAELVKTKMKTLHLLINNAGVMATPYGKTQDGFETQIGTNHFSHFLLFQLLEPLLIASVQETGIKSRVISLSSAGHRRFPIDFDILPPNAPVSEDAYSKWTAYGQSKTANVYMAAALHQHYASAGIVGLSVHPGGIMTGLGKHLKPEDYAVFGDWNEVLPILKSPEQGAATTVFAAVSSFFDDTANGGVYLADCGVCQAATPEQLKVVGGTGYGPHAYDGDAAERLWQLSYPAVGLKSNM